MADLDFGTPCRADMLIGADGYDQTVWHGQQFGPLGFPIAIKTHFGWVLSGPTTGKGKSGQNLCYLSMGCDKKQRRLWRSADLNQPALALKKQAVAEHIREDHS